MLAFTSRLNCATKSAAKAVFFVSCCATPIDDESIQVCQWAYRNDTEEQAPAADIIAFDRQVTSEDRGVLESTDFDTPLGLGSGEERHMPSDQPGMTMRKRLIELLKAHGEQESRLSTVLGAIAVFASTTNIVSGFLITDRMLKMFKTGDKRDGGQS